MNNNSNELLLISLKDFYSNSTNLKQLIKIVNGTSNISLRLIDWFITNYCKNIKDVHIETKKNTYNIYQNYRSQLKAYKKVKFDPFRRRQRIAFMYDDGCKELNNNEDYLNTTIGQLNFFKWAIENNIIDYISSHLSILEDSMNSYQKLSKENKLNKKSKLPDIIIKASDKDKIIKSIKFGESKSLVCFD